MSVLSTARLRLREMTTDDLDEMAALLGDPEVMRHSPAPTTREQARRVYAMDLTPAHTT